MYSLNKKSCIKKPFELYQGNANDLHDLKEYLLSF